MISVSKDALNAALADLAEELNVPLTKYEEAKDRYEAVGKWLNQPGSALALYSPTIYSQGSFSLGTAVRPVGETEYDIDAVCLLQLKKSGVSQENLKRIVGERLKANGTYAQMLDPKDGKRRCWRLKYADGSKFHLDVIPAIPDDPAWLIANGVPPRHAKDAICITDKESWHSDTEWPRSNPQGYQRWFKERMNIAFERQRKIFAEASRSEIHDVPDYKIRTTLQQVIQLLKRHRDIRYMDDDDKPVSIIITTLAAMVYNNEDKLLDAWVNVTQKMHGAIDFSGGIGSVLNPVNPKENFADKWREDQRKKDLFEEWINAVAAEAMALKNATDLQQVGQMFSMAYGRRDTESALKKYTQKAGISNFQLAPPALPEFLSVPHRKKPEWPIVQGPGVSISARASRHGFRSFNFSSGSRAVPKHYHLRYEAKTNVRGPFDVHWQVVNTGEEAIRANAPRGGFYQGEGTANLVRTERTLYTGIHWVQCFIVQKGVCVAKSKEFIVNIE